MFRAGELSGGNSPRVRVKGPECDGFSAGGKADEFAGGSSLNGKVNKHSVSKSKARGRMYHEWRKENKLWQSTENSEGHLPRERHC